MISHEHQCIFIHIPKTAGTSIEYLLSEKTSGSLHEPLSFYEKEPMFGTYFKFTFVRNPWARLYSVFNYYKKGGNQSHKKLYHPRYFMYSLKRGFKNVQRYTDVDIANKMPTDFECFCLKYLRDRKDFFGRNALLPQVDFLASNNGVSIDFIGKFETLQRDISFVKKKLSIHKTLEHRRKQKSTDYRVVYDATTHDLVEAFYKEDVQTFDYSFGN